MSAPRSPSPLGAQRPEPALGLGLPSLLSRPLAMALVDHLSCSPKLRPTSHRPRSQPTPAPEHILSWLVTRVSSWGLEHCCAPMLGSAAPLHHQARRRSPLHSEPALAHGGCCVPHSCPVDSALTCANSQEPRRQDIES